MPTNLADSIHRDDTLLAQIISDLGQERFTPSPERSELLFDGLRAPIERIRAKILIVAGTNGKGEVTLLTHRALAEQGKSICTWTSPHLISLRERYAQAHGLISYEQLQELWQEHLPFLQKAKASFYEGLFFLFLHWCLRQRPEYILLEVGLGGRLDAVNFFDATVCVLTNVSRDHCEFLGEELSAILREKLAISRKAIPLICGVEEGHLQQMVIDHCEGGKIPLELLSLSSHWKSYDYERRNREVAARALSQLLKQNISWEIFSQQSALPARREIVTCEGNRFILIGAHNPDGMKKALTWVAGRPSLKIDGVIFSFSARPQQDLEEMLRELERFAQTGPTLMPVSFRHAKALDAASLNQLLAPRARALALEKIWEKNYLGQQHTYLVTGSYYLIAAFMRDILQHPCRSTADGPSSGL